MDFSTTKVYQRTRSCYDKILSEFNKKKNSERIRNGGTKEREEEFGEVSKRGKNVRQSDSIDDFESSDDDGVGSKKSLPRGRGESRTKEDFVSGEAEKILQSRKRNGNKSSRNGSIDESEDDCGSDDGKELILIKVYQRKKIRR
ncbi:hypothetical protein OSB04_022349 [Centaurea solstitialis]|uniref:Uncharacterized protein n=1 Tax=Centaurea solstitialis TaxID=347529 RepID=A0AA38T788_9ASTR|nr:hypothetical protein OSB04_022349 [Centaurea solstitialis]